jgi:uncharacterized protein (DUF2147 family)
MKLIKLLVFFVYSSIAYPIFSQENRVLGIWFTENKEAKVEIYKRGNKFFGKIIWAKDPDKLDLKNPDKKLKTRKVVGVEILKDFVLSEKNTWNNGTIYDPKNGKTYSCIMKLRNERELEIRGYISFSWIGRSSIWTKVDS